MTIIPGVAGLGLGSVGPAAAGRRAGQGTGFHLPDAASSTETTAATATEHIDLGGLLAVQETGTETVRDRAARRQGRQMLDLLRALQCAALANGGADDPATLQNLADLASPEPTADDPALIAVMQAIRVRVAVEMARRERG